MIKCAQVCFSAQGVKTQFCDKMYTSVCSQCRWWKHILLLFHAGRDIRHPSPYIAASHPTEEDDEDTDEDMDEDEDMDTDDMWIRMSILRRTMRIRRWIL